jgi:hypothetical protein
VDARLEKPEITQYSESPRSRRRIIKIDAGELAVKLPWDVKDARLFESHVKELTRRLEEAGYYGYDWPEELHWKAPKSAPAKPNKALAGSV